MVERAAVEEALEELLGLPPDEFTPRRNQLVKEMKAAGHREEAQRLAALRRPPIHVWAANHLARERPLALTRLLSAAADLGDAQERAFAGEGGAGERLRRDSGAYQRALDLALREAGALLRQGGRGPAEETLRRVRDVVAGAALGDEELRGRLAAGILIEEPPPPGSTAFTFGGPLPPSTPVKATSGSRAKKGSRSLPRPEIAPAATAGSVAANREDHRRLLEARKAAESTAESARRLAEVARRARRRAEAAAAEAASAGAEADTAEGRASEAKGEAAAAAEVLRNLLER